MIWKMYLWKKKKKLKLKINMIIPDTRLKMMKNLLILCLRSIIYYHKRLGDSSQHEVFLPRITVIIFLVAVTTTRNLTIPIILSDSTIFNLQIFNSCYNSCSTESETAKGRSDNFFLTIEGSNTFNHFIMLFHYSPPLLIYYYLLRCLKRKQIFYQLL